MTGTKSPVRLVKAAKEFNVSIETIVEFLGELGFEVERNPNSKLSPEMYGHLTNEFQEEKHVKEVSKQRGLEYIGKESITIEDVKDKTEKKTPDDFIPDEIMITNVGVRYQTDKPASREVPKVEKEPEVEKVEEIVEEKKEEPVVPEVVEEVAEDVDTPAISPSGESLFDSLS